MLIRARYDGKPIEALIDSGSAANIISRDFVLRNSITTTKLPRSSTFASINGQNLTCSYQTENLPFAVSGVVKYMRFMVIDGVKQDAYLGKPWLVDNNPRVDWKSGRVELQTSVGGSESTKSVWVSWRLQELSSKNDALTLIPEEYMQYSELFDKEKRTLPKHTKWDCEIPLEEGKKPSKGAIYELSEEEQIVLKDYIKTNLDKGFISKSKSPAGHPVLFVKKPGGGLRLCVDYRKLNEITIKNRHPIPLIRELRQKVRKAKVFTKLDLSGAFNLLRMKQGEEWKTAFSTREGLYEYNVMPFGLANAPADFQGAMMEILADFLDLFVIVYLDDILIFSESEVSHQDHVHQVLETLQRHEMRISPEKCSFSVKEVKYLGYILRPGSVAADPEKTKAIRDWPTPATVKDIQSFLGLAGFYQKLVPDYSKTILPLIDLTRKEQRWSWQERHQIAFERCKKKFTEEPVVRNFDPKLETIMESDASDGAIGVCLAQIEDGTRYPVAYGSRKLQPAEVNYDTHDKELLAVKYGCEEWRAYLQGTLKPITVETDHKNLEYFLTTKTLTRRQARWLEFLSEYNLKFVHIPGINNGRADALSRRSDYGTAGKQEKAILKHANGGLILAALTQVETISEEKTFLEEYDKEELEMLKDPEEHGYTKNNNVLYHGDRLYVPRKKIDEVISTMHNELTSGHPGINTTWTKLSRDYYFPRMRTTVTKFVRECDVCISGKTLRNRPQGLLEPVEVAIGPWKTVTMDFIVKLPPSTDDIHEWTYDSILTVVDKYTKYAIFIPCNESMSAPEFAKIFLRWVVAEHGLPQEIITDRDKLFTSKFWEGLLKAMGVKNKMSSAFHPQTDGQSERMNQVIEQYLRFFVNEKQDNWVELLPAGMMAYNDNPIEAIGISPYFANNGRDMRKQPRLEYANNPTALEQATDLVELQDQLGLDLKRISHDMKKKADPHRKNEEFEPGDTVYLNTRNIEFNKTKKLDHLRLGPFRILEKISKTAYRLKLPKGRKIHTVFHVGLLHRAPISTPVLKKWPTRPTKKKEYEVEEILDEDDGLYLVKWKNYPSSENTWEPIENLHNAKKKLADFRQGKI